GIRANPFSSEFRQPFWYSHPLYLPSHCWAQGISSATGKQPRRSLLLRPAQPLSSALSIESIPAPCYLLTTGDFLAK
ncbi:hypothetical protein, partial [Bacillus badius]|uniref:hypothetical protein n=1 Tax=Bacillus badius TaxID=1455 RepID=UPI002E22F9A0|nr:hypothetical protein [Bacillus badius]